MAIPLREQRVRGAPVPRQPSVAVEWGLAYEALVDQTLDALAAHLEAHLDIEKLLSLAR